jgi:hypothetical protein
MRKQLQVEGKPRRVRSTAVEVRPLDPRDPDVLRAEAWLRGRGPRSRSHTVDSAHVITAIGVIDAL